MISLHVFMAMLATWRLTELFTQDRITERLRTALPGYLWQCSRCVSVWASALALGLFLYQPYLNWIFALSWTYIVFKAWKPRHHKVVVSVSPDGSIEVDNPSLSKDALTVVLGRVISSAHEGLVNG